MLEIIYRKKFEKELEMQKRRGKDLQKFVEIARKLVNEEKLDLKYRNHKLVGNFNGRWECHIEPDWLIIYTKNEKEIIFERTGSHADLFK